MGQGRFLLYPAGRNPLQRWLLGVGLLWVVSSASAGLRMEALQAVYGAPQEIIHEIPGRPWVEVQHRYEEGHLWITCNYVGEHCLWIDYGFKELPVEEALIFAELERILPGSQWNRADEHGRLKRWFNEAEDRVTLRSGGFTLHMNEYIRNVLSRRAQWQF